MAKTLALLPVVALVGALASAACFFGGGGGGGGPSIERPSSIPTATPPATLPEPMLVGEAQVGSPASNPVLGENTYVVKSGDTLNSIAIAQGIAAGQLTAWVAEVLRINGIPDATLLQAGVELRLPRAPATPRPSGTAPAGATGTAAARTNTPAPRATIAIGTSATPRPTVAAVGGGGTYTVVDGDNPHAIGQKLGVPASALAAWADQLLALNGITAQGLQVGQVLQLPPIPTPTP